MAREIREETEMDTNKEVDEDSDSLYSSTLKLYETQFFGFTPQTCMLRVYSAFQDCLYDILPVVEKVCVRQLSRGESDGSEEVLRSRARECSRKLQQFLDEQFKQLSKRMETLLLERCLSVPPNVLLSEDQAHKNQAHKNQAHKDQSHKNQAHKDQSHKDQSHKDYPQHIQEVLRLESNLGDLQSAYEAEVCARQALLAELEEQKEVQKQLDGVLMWVRELQAAWVKEGNGSFHESFQMVMESVKRLQEAVREVCQKAPH